MTLHETLAAGIVNSCPGSIIKKFNKDNFLDIHLPFVNKERATHLFFNTPKAGIKIGFYCRDEKFVKATLKKSKKLESYSQGVRLKDNPVFESADLAIKAAIEFVNLMTEAKAKKVVKPTIKESPKVMPKLKKVPPQISTLPNAEIQETKSVGFWQWLIMIFK
jgi:hypothetical protein